MPDVAHRLVAALTQRGLTLATAESLTAGGVAAAVAAVPGASATLLGGVVTYATAQKTRLLGISAELLRQEGVVSARTAAEMASGVLALTGADVGLATTGVAGPARLEDRPAGTVHVAVAWAGDATRSRTVSFEADRRLSGDRARIRAQTVTAVLELCLASLGNPGPGRGVVDSR